MMAARDTLLLGRVSGALQLCHDLRLSHRHSNRTRRWAYFGAWVLTKLHAALKDDIDDGRYL